MTMNGWKSSTVPKSTVWITLRCCTDAAMRAYQQQAVELAFLHDRYLRGTAPRDFAERGASMVERLRALRPYVAFPRPPAAPWGGSR